jgi:hypothetical protein
MPVAMSLLVLAQVYIRGFPFSINNTFSAYATFPLNTSRGLCRSNDIKPRLTRS